MGPKISFSSEKEIRSLKKSTGHKADACNNQPVQGISIASLELSIFVFYAMKFYCPVERHSLRVFNKKAIFFSVFVY